MTRPLIAYVRVSTSKQGRSGLALEAQQEALSRFASQRRSVRSLACGPKRRLRQLRRVECD